MAQFHETGFGQSFYRSQLPELIDALKQISKHLETINESIEKANEASASSDEEDMGAMRWYMRVDDTIDPFKLEDLAYDILNNAEFDNYDVYSYDKDGLAKLQRQLKSRGVDCGAIQRTYHHYNECGKKINSFTAPEQYPDPEETSKGVKLNFDKDTISDDSVDFQYPEAPPVPLPTYVGATKCAARLSSRKTETEFEAEGRKGAERAARHAYLKYMTLHHNDPYILGLKDEADDLANSREQERTESRETNEYSILELQAEQAKQDEQERTKSFKKIVKEAKETTDEWEQEDSK